VGGDYYDFLELPDGRFGIAIGDVSGKGVGAALMMASLEASLRALPSVVDDPAELMERVSSLVNHASSANRYATLFYGQYDPASRRLSYVNAGHNPPVVLRDCGGYFHVFRLETGGPLIGLLRHSYERGVFTHQARDLLVLFTDGVSESMNARFEEWGEERLIEFAKTCYALPATEGLRRILSAEQAFATGASQHDDMTLVVLRVS
jgi:sigma-B regulation protein RsbU (phosphoserine phosphatase)